MMFAPFASKTSNNNIAQINSKSWEMYQKQIHSIDFLDRQMLLNLSIGYSLESLKPQIVLQCLMNLPILYTSMIISFSPVNVHTLEASRIKSPSVIFKMVFPLVCKLLAEDKCKLETSRNSRFLILAALRKNPSHFVKQMHFFVIPPEIKFWPASLAALNRTIFRELTTAYLFICIALIIVLGMPFFKAS